MNAKAMTWGDLMQEGRGRLQSIEHAHGKLAWWVSATLDCSLTTIPLEGEPCAEEQAAFYNAVTRLAKHEPVQYIVGRVPFRDIDVDVGPATLIPRPETEQLLDLVLPHVLSGQTWLDVGTGSGCIALSMAVEKPGLTVTGIDLSEQALAIARSNAQMLNVDVTFLRGDLLGAWTEPVDGIVANLPYIPSSEMPSLPEDVRLFEPHSALDGGPDGLDLIARLLDQARGVLSTGSHVFLETAETQNASLAQLGRNLGYTMSFHKDLAGRPRFTIATRNSTAST